MKATKQQWAEVFRNYEAIAQGMVALHRQPSGLFSFTRLALRWFELNP